MHQSLHLQRRIPHGALVMLERSAAKVARCVLRGERSREAPDLPGEITKKHCRAECTILPAKFKR